MSSPLISMPPSGRNGPSVIQVAPHSVLGIRQAAGSQIERRELEVVAAHEAALRVILVSSSTMPASVVPRQNFTGLSNTPR